MSPSGIVWQPFYQESSDPQVTGWFTYWKPHRPFAMDMAGFAVNLRLILQHPNAQFTNAVQRGYQESTLLTGLGVMLADLEPKASGCTRVCALLFFLIILGTGLIKLNVCIC